MPSAGDSHALSSAEDASPTNPSSRGESRIGAAPAARRGNRGSELPTNSAAAGSKRSKARASSQVAVAAATSLRRSEIVEQRADRPSHAAARFCCLEAQLDGQDVPSEATDERAEHTRSLVQLFLAQVREANQQRIEDRGREIAIGLGLRSEGHGRDHGRAQRGPEAAELFEQWRHVRRPTRDLLRRREPGVGEPVRERLRQALEQSLTRRVVSIHRTVRDPRAIGDVLHRERARPPPRSRTPSLRRSGLACPPSPGRERGCDRRGLYSINILSVF